MLLLLLLPLVLCVGAVQAGPTEIGVRFSPVRLFFHDDFDDFFISIPGINVIYGEYFISDHASFGSNFLFYGSDEYWSSNISGVVSYYPFGHTTSSFYGRAEIGSILSERGNDGTFWGIGLGRINETRYFVWRTEINYNHIIDWHVNKELSFVFALGKKF